MPKVPASTYLLGVGGGSGPHNVRSITARKWDFNRSTVFYLLEDRGGKGRPVAIEQAEIQRRIKVAAERDP